MKFQRSQTSRMLRLGFLKAYNNNLSPFHFVTYYLHHPMIRTRSTLNMFASSWIRRTSCASLIGRRSFTSQFSSGPKPFNLRKELDRIQNLHTSEDQFIQEITAKKPKIEESIFCNQEIEFISNFLLFFFFFFKFIFFSFFFFCFFLKLIFFASFFPSVFQR